MAINGYKGCSTSRLAGNLEGKPYYPETSDNFSSVFGASGQELQHVSSRLTQATMLWPWLVLLFDSPQVHNGSWLVVLEVG